MIATQGSTEGDEVTRFRNGFMGDAGVAPVQDDANDEVSRFREGFKSGDKVAGVFDWLKPAGDGVSSSTHAAMKEAGVGPYEGSDKAAKPSPSGADYKAEAADARIRQLKADDDERAIAEKVGIYQKTRPSLTPQQHRKLAREALGL